MHRVQTKRFEFPTMTEQDSLIKFCKHCGKRNVSMERSECKECGGPLLKQVSLVDV